MISYILKAPFLLLTRFLFPPLPPCLFLSLPLSSSLSLSLSLERKNIVSFIIPSAQRRAINKGGDAQLKRPLTNPVFGYPRAFYFSKFALNHRISTMMFLTGNFRNTVDRDGLHGGPIGSHAFVCW